MLYIALTRLASVGARQADDHDQHKYEHGHNGCNDELHLHVLPPHLAS